MTRGDLLVGVTAGLVSVACVVFAVAVVAGRRADRRAKAADRVAAESAMDDLERWLAKGSRPAVPAQKPAPVVESTVEPLPLPTRSLHTTPIDPSRTDQLLDEIRAVLAGAVDTVPDIEVVGETVWLSRGRVTGDGLRKTRCDADGVCNAHDPMTCRRNPPCCGACPTDPAPL